MITDAVQGPIRHYRITLFCLGFLFCYVFFYWPVFTLQDFSQWPWLIPALTFVAVPIVDALVGEFRWNWNQAERTWIKKQIWMRCLPLLAVPAFLSYQILIFQYFSAAGTWVAKAGWLLTIGIAGGVLAINVAHELIHRKTGWERGTGALLLMSVFYGSFKVEHVYGHHTWVATPKDMTTAPKGMTLYQFWMRALTKTPVKAWQLSVQQAAKKKGKGKSVGHELLWLTCGSLFFALVYFVLFGLLGLLYWIVQSLLSILLLETVNYIEHYGLKRRQKDNGKYEPITPLHSWNSSRLITNYLLFNLQRHSDHHANASLTYPLLRHFDESPQLPQGYAAMILLSLFPPLWFRVMNPKLKSAI